jgi:glutathione S-transferase
MMTMQLHYYPSTAAMVPHILLEEIGTKYERVLVDRTRNDHKTAAYLQLNPNGLIPVLTDGDLVLYETAAIVLHLCDNHPDARMAPPLRSRERAHFYKWLAWLTNTLQATLIVYFYPERWVNEGNAAGAAELKEKARERIAPLLDQLEAQLARSGGPWFLGREFSALDPYVFTLCRWTRNFSEGRARDRAPLAAYLQRVLERPAVQRVMQVEKIEAPYY